MKLSFNTPFVSISALDCFLNIFSSHAKGAKTTPFQFSSLIFGKFVKKSCFVLTMLKVTHTNLFLKVSTHTIAIKYAVMAETEWVGGGGGGSN